MITLCRSRRNLHAKFHYASRPAAWAMPYRGAYSGGRWDRRGVVMVSDDRPLCGWSGATRRARCPLLQGYGKAAGAQVVCLSFPPRSGDPGAGHLAALPGCGDARQLPGCFSAMTRAPAWPRTGAAGTRPGCWTQPEVTKHAWCDVAQIDPNATSRDGSWCSF